MPYRLERFSSTLKQHLADILSSEIENPHLRAVSIYDVVVSPDLKKARIYVSSLTLTPDDLVQKLTQARGFIKKLLAERMYLKYMPELIFVFYDTLGKQNGHEKENS